MREAPVSFAREGWWERDAAKASLTGTGGTNEDHADLLCRLRSATELALLQRSYPAFQLVNDGLQALDLVVDVAHLDGVETAAA